MIHFVHEQNVSKNHSKQKKRSQGKNDGFTLIELLVVVLIIAILAAIAWPRYEMAVEKAKFVKLIPWFRAIKEGRKMFLLQGGDRSCMDLSRYLLAIGKSGGYSYCTETGEEGPCPDTSFRCHSALKVGEYTISTGSGMAYAGWRLKQSGMLMHVGLLLDKPSASSGLKELGLYCCPSSGDSYGDKWCKNLSSSKTLITGYWGNLCYEIDF